MIFHLGRGGGAVSPLDPCMTNFMKKLWSPKSNVIFVSLVNIPILVKEKSDDTTNYLFYEIETLESVAITKIY